LSVRAPVGALNIADREYGIGRGICAIRPRQVHSRFCWWWLHARLDDLQSLATGSTYPAVTIEDVGTLRMPEYDTSHQKAIADFLDSKTRLIDLLLVKKRQMQHLLAEREIVAVAKLFGQELQFRADGTPTGIGQAPSMRLGGLATVQSGLTLDSTRNVGIDSVTLPYLRVANVLDGSLALEELKTVIVSRSMASRFQLRAGDVLMTEGGDPDKLGRGAVWSGEIDSCLHQNHVFAVRPDQSKLLPAYLSLLSRTTYARAYFVMYSSKTSGFASKSASMIAAF
jgi:type I restriction enzyme S subunit